MNKVDCKIRDIDLKEVEGGIRVSFNVVYDNIKKHVQFGTTSYNTEKLKEYIKQAADKQIEEILKENKLKYMMNYLNEYFKEN